MQFSAVVLSIVAAAATTSAFVVPSARCAVPSLLCSAEMKDTTETAPTTTTTTTETEIPENKEFEDKVVEATAAELSAAAAVAVPAPKVEEPEVVVLTDGIDKSKIVPGRYDDIPNSIALPFMKRPPKLDGTHAGDFGFDPLGFTESYDLYTMQESELRHARLAMLAVIGWPLSELLAPSWMLQANGCAPSVLNGMNIPSFVAIVAAFGAIGYFEVQTSLRRTDDTELGLLHRADMKDVTKYGVAGDYNFDPLNLYSSIGDNAFARKGLREVEISHGRSAMLGITAFAAWEALTGHAIVDSGAMFFHPNLALPALFAAYQAFWYFYEQEEDDTFIKFKMSSEGSARWENLKIGLPGGGPPPAAGSGSAPLPGEGIIEFAKAFPKKATSFVDGAQEKYGNLEKMYMDNIVNKK